jgi:hypothetical protein
MDSSAQAMYRHEAIKTGRVARATKCIHSMSVIPA